MADLARRYLERGLYREALTALSRRSRPSGDEITSLIGAHAFLGHFEEALEHWSTHEKKLDEAQRIRSRFFLGVSATRASKLKLARDLFRANLDVRENHPAGRAYAYQGRAFYLYYAGEFRRAAVWARKASVAALKSKDHYPRFLALELLGHCRVQLGKRSDGLRLMKRASELAQAHGNLNFASSFANASLIYEAELGVRPLNIVSELRSSLRGLKAQDSYTRSTLILELARQWTLRGQWSEARELLDREASSVYASNNRRLELLLQLRLAELAVCQGDRFALEHFLRSATRCLLKVADRAYEIRILGLDLKSRRIFGMPIPPELPEKLFALSRTHSSHIGDQILFRQGHGADPGVSEAEDPLHHLLLRGEADPARAAEEALALGYGGLWHRFRSLSPGQSAFTVLADGRSVVLSSPSGVVLRSEVLTRQSLRLLQSLQGGVSEKDALVRAVWGYRYDKLRHDPLLHTTLTKLRKSIEPASAWIITTENGWRLSPEVRWEIPKRPPMSAAPIQRAAAPSVESALNFRQMSAIEKRDQPLWSIQQYKKTFKVSTMTAFRDLTGLTTLGYLARTGRGRATRYRML